MFLSTISEAMSIGGTIGDAVATMTGDDNAVASAIGSCIGAGAGVLIAGMLVAAKGIAEVAEQYGC